jgi:hypothetical protein
MGVSEFDKNMQTIDALFAMVPGLRCPHCDEDERLTLVYEETRIRPLI